MKSYQELKEIFSKYSWSQMNVHVHTHLCDGKPDMTVANIAAQAEKDGVKLIVLTPHFHKQLKDSETVLYEDVQESIFTHQMAIGTVHLIPLLVKYKKGVLHIGEKSQKIC